MPILDNGQLDRQLLYFTIRTGWEGTGSQFPLNPCTGRPLTESDDTRCCINTIRPADDEHRIL